MSRRRSPFASGRRIIASTPRLLDEVKLDGAGDPASLSGGEGAVLPWRALWSPEPDVLLRCEPTNHLDLPTIGWLGEARDVEGRLRADEPRSALPDSPGAGGAVARPRHRAPARQRAMPAFESGQGDPGREATERHKLDRPDRGARPNKAGSIRARRARATKAACASSLSCEKQRRQPIGAVGRATIEVGAAE